MTEHPILFSGPMIKALLAGTKTQTRRVIKPQPIEARCCHLTSDGHALFFKGTTVESPSVGQPIDCPYGQPGDHLWVRESLVMKDSPVDPLLAVANYAADGALVIRKDALHDVGYEDWLWQRPTLPSIHMPYWASRITLELTGVRAERVQDISDADVIAEGAFDPHWTRVGNNVQMRYADLWDSINGKRGYGWDVNPWVWVLAFKRIDV